MPKDILRNSFNNDYYNNLYEFSILGLVRCAGPPKYIKVNVKPFVYFVMNIEILITNLLRS